KLISWPSSLPKIPGYKTVSSVYEYDALSSFNGYPESLFDKPVMIVLPYDPALLGGKSANSLQIISYNKATKTWVPITTNLVIDQINHTIATTVKTFTYFVVGYL